MAFLRPLAGRSRNSDWTSQGSRVTRPSLAESTRADSLDVVFGRPLLGRRLRALRAAANRHPVGQRPGRDAEASLHQVVAKLAIERETVGINPERDRGPAPG